jgi:hypothetical protein
VEGLFYERLQYHGSVHQGRRNERQPVPESRNVLEDGGASRSPEES